MSTCVLCDQLETKNATHVFETCGVAQSVRHKVLRWLAINAQLMEGQETIKLIRMKKWKRFQKEIIAVAYGAMIYNILINRNAKIFRGHNVNIEFLFHQVQITVRERVEIYKEAKFARKVMGFINRICNKWIFETLVS